MDERALESLLDSLTKGNLTDDEHRQVLDLLRTGRHRARIRKKLYETQLLYVQSAQDFVWASLTRSERLSAQIRSSRSLRNIRKDYPE
jgi:hypothetical protein